MKMNILINENQKRFLIVEGISDNFAKDTKKLFDITKKVLSDSSKQLKMNLEFLLTWGASIGGFMGPLNQFLEGKYPELSSTDVSLILTGVISILYYDNKDTIKKILELIKDKNLSKQFKSTLQKGNELKNVFFDFVSSLNMSVHKISNIMSYTFIVPLLPMIYQMAQSGAISPDDTIKIVNRLLGFGFLTVSGVTLKELIERIIKKFSN
jgi:hypothetical protein